MLVIAVLGFVVTWTTGVIALTRAVERIKADTSEKVSQETDKIEERLAQMVQRFSEDQKRQDDRTGEMGAAIRQYAAGIEKEMHAIEIWGRDNYVLKSEFLKATDQLRSDIRGVGEDVKSVLRTLAERT